MSEFKKRIVDPMMLPMMAAAFIAVLVFATSRILLAIPKEGSTTVAFLMAAEVLGVAAVLAAVNRIRASQRLVLVVIGLSLIGGGAAAASLGVRDVEHHAEEVSIVAKDIRFVEETLTFPADTEVNLVFQNNDAGVPHNVAISTDEAFRDLVFDPGQTGTINGVASITYQIEPLAAGTYFYVCTIHPATMTGELTVGGEGGGHGDEAPPEETSEPEPAPSPEPSPEPTETATAAPGTGPTSATVVAKNIAFVQKELELAASSPVELVFDNQDNSVPHNVAITTEEGGKGEVVFRGEIFNGVETKTYAFTAPSAGLYHFICDVHPNMKGTITFS